MCICIFIYIIFYIFVYLCLHLYVFFVYVTYYYDMILTGGQLYRLTNHSTIKSKTLYLLYLSISIYIHK